MENLYLKLLMFFSSEILKKSIIYPKNNNNIEIDSHNEKDRILS